MIRSKILQENCNNQLHAYRHKLKPPNLPMDSTKPRNLQKTPSKGSVIHGTDHTSGCFRLTFQNFILLLETFITPIMSRIMAEQSVQLSASSITETDLYMVSPNVANYYATLDAFLALFIFLVNSSTVPMGITSVPFTGLERKFLFSLVKIFW